MWKQFKKNLPERTKYYMWGQHNPYVFTAAQEAVLQDHLNKLKQGKISLESFFRQTPQIAQWHTEHIRQSRILIISCEPGLSRAETIYKNYPSWSGAGDVASAYHLSMLSWLGMHTHPLSGAINGEPGWQTGGSWEGANNALRMCGKAGYFLSTQEAITLQHSQFIHIDAAPFPQRNGDDPNPQNHSAIAHVHHARNKDLVHQFCRFNQGEIGYVCITADRLAIANDDGASVSFTPRQDKNNYADRLLELIAIAGDRKQPPQLRAITTWFKSGQATLRRIAMD
ncbi:MAG: hypothetical protein B6I36_10960 [Desulfobacteraceae bacterium 4572_35.1]|nr:MAG: hypothetical protein B6I36_10960 [Desulfobacteraceae bacterium 4572_35.1]